jgi:predicted heme/steroid binding protein
MPPLCILGIWGREMKVFSLSELSKYNGKRNMPAYIAYKGKVYDVSNSFLWKGGN